MSDPKIGKLEQRSLADFLADKLLDLAPNLATHIEWDLPTECVLKIQVSDASLPAVFSVASRNIACTFQELLHNAVDIFGAHASRASQSSHFAAVTNPWIVFRVFYAMGRSELEVQLKVS